MSLELRTILISLNDSISRICKVAVTSIDFYKFWTGPDVLLSVLIIISGLVIYLFAFALFIFYSGQVQKFSVIVRRL